MFDSCVCVVSVGFVDVPTEDIDVNSKNNNNYASSLKIQTPGGISLSGGRWAPDWCVARQRIAVIIPFRNRKRHLKIFLRHMRPVLQRQLLDYTIFVVEQVDPIDSMLYRASVKLVVNAS